MITADISTLTAEAASSWFSVLKPPPRLSLSQWCEENARLYDGTVFRPYPYQRDILDAMTDPDVKQITMMKSARVGYTQMLSAAIAYFIARKPSKIMIVQPTTEDAEDYSKDTIDPLADWPVLSNLLADAGAKSKLDTIKRKEFPGGSLKITGANSPRAFRRIDLDKIFFDEVDAYPAVAGKEGDQIMLGKKRMMQSQSPLCIMGSTPLIDGQSKIQDAFERGTMEYYHVPCPHCGEFQPLIWGDGTGAGMRWTGDDPETTVYICAAHGCVIEEYHKSDMLDLGKWVATNEFKGHRSFHIWSAYCPLPGASWKYLVQEFLEAKDSRDSLQVWTNTVRGEVWLDRGEAPDWCRLYERREFWEAGTVPRGGLFLTSGVDVQRDRLECSIWAWGRGKESWLIDHLVLPGDPFGDAVWRDLSAVLGSTYRHETGIGMSISMAAIDSGDGVTSEVVKGFCRSAGGRVMAVKGSSQPLAPLLGSPVATDINRHGQRLRGQAGCRVWPVGVSAAKSELYGWLRLVSPTEESGEPIPPGFVHLPLHVGEEYCRQLVAEHRVTRGGKGKPRTTTWEKLRERNEALDTRVYARAAAARIGLDTMSESRWTELEAALGTAPPSRKPPPQNPTGPFIQTDAPPPPPAMRTGVPHKKVIRSSFCA